ncbi:RNA-binding protein [Candidatus Curtissbacteria bacterium]|nr:RNA-binding protein [Candidatus Curtissbacteria bacterium]
MAKRLFVGSLPYIATSAQLEELFAKIGKVASVNLITDKFSGQSKGFAFVEMETEEEAKEAIAKLNNTELDGRRIVVNEAKPQEDRTRQNRGNYQRSNRW